MQPLFQTGPRLVVTDVKCTSRIVNRRFMNYGTASALGAKQGHNVGQEVVRDGEEMLSVREKAMGPHRVYWRS